jgi:hypothetical protein
VFAVCVPVYVVFVPVVTGWQWLQRRLVRVGGEITHWPMRDVRQDYVVVDVSRGKSEGRVGVRVRRWGVLGRRKHRRLGRWCLFRWGNFG